MRDELSLRRLGEIGIDVYWPRTRGALPGTARRARTVVPLSAATRAAAARPGENATPAPLRFLLLAEATSPREHALLADIVRALTSECSACAHAAVPDEFALTDATALVVFGEARARGVGALLSAHRQREIGWVVTGELGSIAAEATAKRALWSELKRALRPH